MLAGIFRKVAIVSSTPRHLPRLRQTSCARSAQLFSSRVSRFSTMSSFASDYLVWVDLEMTGLDISKDHIIEMAVLITDKDLNLVAEVRAA